MEDLQILEALFARSEKALAALAEKYGKGLLSLAMNILGSRADAEETVNDTYLALWNAIPPQRPEPLAPYVYRTGRNQALKRLRANTAQKRDSRYDLCLDELSDALPGGTAEEALDARLLGQAIERYLATLSRDQRVLFIKRYWFGQSVSDIAKEAGLSAGAVSTRLSRMRAALRAQLEKEDFYL